MGFSLSVRGRFSSFHAFYCAPQGFLLILRSTEVILEADLVSVAHAMIFTLKEMPKSETSLPESIVGHSKFVSLRVL